MKDVTNRKLYSVDQLYIPLSTIDFVEKELNSLNATKAIDADNIHENIDQVASTLSNELQQVNKWCENNHMAINISNTKLMYVTSKPTHRQLSNTHSLPSVQLLDYVVDESTSERLLGVTINNDLSWNTQVENVIKKCNTFL